jgi:hypothetical protein
MKGELYKELEKLSTRKKNENLFGLSVCHKTYAANGFYHSNLLFYQSHCFQCHIVYFHPFLATPPLQRIFEFA